MPIKNERVEVSSKKSGTGLPDVYNSKRQFYCHLLFLKNNFNLHPTETHLKRTFSSSFKGKKTEEVRSTPIKNEH